MCCFPINSSFNLTQQLIIPLSSGIIGGIAVIIMASLNTTLNILNFNERATWSFVWKFAFIGGIAGVAAVNLLNPNGDISQVMVLGLIAGLSGVSYLKRTALVEDIHEQMIFDALRKKAEEVIFTDSNNQEVKISVEKDEYNYYEEMEKTLDSWLSKNEDVSEKDYNEFIDELAKSLEDWLSTPPEKSKEDVKIFLNNFEQTYNKNP